MAVNRIKLIGKKSEAKEGGGVVLQVSQSFYGQMIKV